MALNDPEKALILRVNRRLAAASKKFGIPLHQLRTRRSRYKFGTEPTDLWNVESARVVDEDIRLKYYDGETRFEFRGQPRTADVIVWLRKIYATCAAA